MNRFGKTYTREPRPRVGVAGPQGNYTIGRAGPPRPFTRRDVTYQKKAYYPARWRKRKYAFLCGALPGMLSERNALPHSEERSDVRICGPSACTLFPTNPYASLRYTQDDGVETQTIHAERVMQGACTDSPKDRGDP